jgi:MoxR-like ATPase
MGVPLRSLNIHPTITQDDLIGSFQPNVNRGKPNHPDTDKILVLKPGHLVDAMRRGEWLVLEELNMASSSTVELLNFYLSHGKAYIEENGEFKEIEIHKRFRLFATQNPVGTGRQELSKAFLSRWVHWIIPSDKGDEGEHLNLLLKTLHGLPNTTSLPLVELHQLIANSAKSWTEGWASSDPYVFNQRHLLRLVHWLNQQKDQGEFLSAVRSLNDLKPEERKQWVIGLWDTYAISLREPLHRAKLFELLQEDPSLGLSELGIHSVNDMERLWAEKMLGGRKDTNDDLALWAKEKLSHEPSVDSLSPEESTGDNVAVTTEMIDNAKKQIPGAEHRLPLVSSQRRVLRAMVEGLFANDHVALVGPWAAGKTSLIFALYEMLGKPLFYFNLHQNVSLDELIGVPETNKNARSEYRWGPLVMAMLTGSALFIDEPNLSELPEWLNTVMDTGELALPNGQVIKAKKGFRIITAMNPPKVRGRVALSPALKSRSREIWVDEITDPKELEEIARHKLGGLSDHTITHRDPNDKETVFQLAPFLVKMHKELQAKHPDQGYSLRDFMRFADFVLGEAKTLGPTSISMGLLRFYGMQLPSSSHLSFEAWLIGLFGGLEDAPRVETVSSFEDILAGLLPKSLPEKFRRDVAAYEPTRRYLFSLLNRQPETASLLVAALSSNNTDIREAAWYTLAYSRGPLPKGVADQVLLTLNDANSPAMLDMLGFLSDHWNEVVKEKPSLPSDFVRWFLNLDTENNRSHSWQESAGSILIKKNFKFFPETQQREFSEWLLSELADSSDLKRRRLLSIAEDIFNDLPPHDKSRLAKWLSEIGWKSEDKHERLSAFALARGAFEFLSPGEQSELINWLKYSPKTGQPLKSKFF